MMKARIRLEDTLAAAGRPVTYLLYPDEGHGLQRAANRLAFYPVAEAFLAHYLGSGAALSVDALAGSSTQVIMDTVPIPGLAEAAAAAAGSGTAA